MRCARVYKDKEGQIQRCPIRNHDGVVFTRSDGVKVYFCRSHTPGISLSKESKERILYMIPRIKQAVEARS